MTEFIIYKKDGAVTNMPVLVKNLKELADGRYMVRVENAKKRSLNQNAYYHKIVCQYVYEGLRDLGHSLRNKDDAHEVLKRIFLDKKERIGETEITIPGSTRKLTTTEFKEYLFNIEVWASDYLNVSIPPPNTQLSTFSNG